MNFLLQDKSLSDKIPIFEEDNVVIQKRKKNLKNKFDCVECINLLEESDLEITNFKPSTKVAEK